MKMQKLFENWNKFKSGVVKEDLLNEVSYETAEHIEDWLGNHGNEMSMPFNDIFKGKMRTIVPLGKSLTPGSTIHKIVDWLKGQGYEVDFKTGLASKGFTGYTGKPGAPGTKEVVRVKHQKIGKVLQRADTLIKKKMQAALARDKRRGDLLKDNPGQYDEVHNDEEWARLRDEANKADESYKKHFRYDTYGRTLEEWVKFWNKESRYYRENPDEMMTDYSIIISRHPVDVLRMSDFANIESCHTEGKEYFHCAVKEAKGHGPIAYIVETQDLQDLDIDDNEIFEDRERDVEGIEPIGRVRLRRFDKTGRTFSDNMSLSLLVVDTS